MAVCLLLCFSSLDDQVISSFFVGGFGINRTHKNTMSRKCFWGNLFLYHNHLTIFSRMLKVGHFLQNPPFSSMAPTISHLATHDSWVEGSKLFDPKHYTSYPPVYLGRCYAFLFLVKLVWLSIWIIKANLRYWILLGNPSGTEKYE